MTFEHYEEDEMFKWIETNLRKFWEINIERFPSSATIVKFRWTQEAEEEINGTKKKIFGSVEDDL